MKTTMDRQPIRPDRVRSIKESSFAFLPHRFLQCGFFASLSKDELALYVILVLAADRFGQSFYSYERLCSLLSVELDMYIQSRNGLIKKNLIAFDGMRFQVLSLPAHPTVDDRKPLEQKQDLENQDGATIRATILSTLGPPR